MARPAEHAGPRVHPKEAILDAAERLLVDVGHAGITARGLAAEAGVNLGLIHYYFGSMENVFLEALERFTDRLIARQRAMYAAEEPFIEKWRKAMRYLEEDRVTGYQKVWLELQAMAWNRPDLARRIVRVTARWRRVLTEAFAKAMEQYGLDQHRFPVEAVVALVATFNQGIILERHAGIFEGHQQLLDLIDGWLLDLEAEAGRR